MFQDLARMPTMWIIVSKIKDNMFIMENRVSHQKNKALKKPTDKMENIR